MATYVVKFTVIDAKIVAALEDAKTSRQISSLVVAALGHYIRSPVGKETLKNLKSGAAGKTDKKKGGKSARSEKPATKIDLLDQQAPITKTDLIEHSRPQESAPLKDVKKKFTSSQFLAVSLKK